VAEAPLERPEHDLALARLLRQVRHLEAGKIEFHHYPPVGKMKKAAGRQLPAASLAGDRQLGAGS
jgi:hypothetical protein